MICTKCYGKKLTGMVVHGYPVDHAVDKTVGIWTTLPLIESCV